MLKKLKTITAIALAVGSVAANAATFAEKESLARLLHELDVITSLANQAESHSNPDSRIKFQYNLLRKDIARIGLGVKEHLDAPAVEPRQYEPLSGDYRR
ncbi:MAG: RAQPRD family integrative conjugative element protein [Gammaproteobacteria bacterium]|nr:RAQPRD family integrative conjugative element protein [Gammaproteobacteria bacterium]